MGPRTCHPRNKPLSMFVSFWIGVNLNESSESPWMWTAPSMAGVPYCLPTKMGYTCTVSPNKPSLPQAAFVIAAVSVTNTCTNNNNEIINKMMMKTPGKYCGSSSRCLKAMETRSRKTETKRRCPALLGDFPALSVGVLGKPWGPLTSQN